MITGSWAGQPLATRWRAWLGGTAASCVAAALLAIAAGAPAGIAIGFGTLGATVLAVAALRDWAFGLCAFTAWLAVGDLLRKFTGNSLANLGATELIALAAMARFILEWSRGRVPRLRTPVTVPLAVFAGWAVARALPALATEPLVALNGLHAWIFFTPLLYAGYAMGAGNRDDATWVTAALAVGVLAATGGLIQFGFGLDMLNPADTGGLPLKLLHSSDVEPVPRPNSVFMHAGRLSGVLLAVLWTVPAAVMRMQPGRSGARAPVAAAAGITLAGLVFSGQRATIVCLAAGAMLAAVAAARQLSQAGARLRLGLSVGAVAVVLLVGFGFAVSDTATVRFYGDLFSPRWLEVALEDVEYTGTGVRYALETTLWGHGTGAASTGRAYALDVLWNDAAVMPLEGGTGVLLWEWGPAGLALWVWLAGTVVRELWRRTRAAASLSTACVCAGALAAAVTSMGLWFHLTAAAYQSYPLQALLWLTVGNALAAGDRAAASR